MSSCSDQVQKAFAALLSLCKDRHTYLKAALKYCEGHIKDAVALENLSYEVRANLYFYPLKLACESKEDALVAIALNAIQQLIAHNALDASVAYKAPDVPAPVKKKGLFGLGSKDEEAAAPTPKADASSASGGATAGTAGESDPLEAIPLVSIMVAAACLNGASTSEEVQIRVVRNLLMFVSYPEMRVHGKVLLSAINTSYNVFLVAKSISVQATAKAALSQMIGIVQQRAEAECEGHHTVLSGISLSASAASANIASAIAAAAGKTSTAANAVSNGDTADTTAATADNDNDEDAPMVPAAEGHALVAPAVEELVEAKEEVASESNVNADEGTPEPTPLVGGATVKKDTETGDNTTERSVSPTPSAAARTGSFLASPTPTTTTLLADDGTAADEGTEFGSESERDCFLILRSLSKLSAKVIPEGENAKPESPEFRGKLQALNMIYHFIMTVGTELKARRSFRFALRQYVARSLLESCMSASIEIARVALNTMQRLACDYRSVLQRETVVFFYNILFPVLESPNSSFEHRFIALQIMESVLSDGQSVMDLFANYDCVIGGTNLVSDLVNRCSKASQTSHVAANWITPKQDGDLRIQSVRTLTAMMAALTEWVHTLAPPTPLANRSRIPAMLGAAGDSVASQAAALGGASGDGGNKGNSTTTGNTTDSASSPLSQTEDGGDSVNRMLSNKKAYEVVIEAFNRKGAKAGIAQAITQSILKEESPEELASFFLSTKGLDKVRIGEFLAPNKPHVKEVLKAFINQFNFEGLEIDEAMRVFLGKFKIQGEAETVDRTMEQFAQRYCDQNPSSFSSAGTAYVLAFSIMMLNTDAHSIHVKDKMQLADFHRTLRGIDDGKDLPEDLVDGVYHRITTREIKLDGDNSSSSSAATRAAAAARDQKTDRIFSSLASKKSEGYKRETDKLVKTSLAMLNDTSANDGSSSGSGDQLGGNGLVSISEFISADHPAIAKAFWDIAWTAVLPSLSFPMEESTNQQLIDFCLEGFDKAMSLTCIFNDATQREAFLGTLAGFTHLTNTKEMGYKNVKSIVTMMRVASREGDALEGSWYDVLKCISSLDKLHILSAAIDREALAHQNSGGGQGSSSLIVGGRLSSSTSAGGDHHHHKDSAVKRTATYEAHNAEIVSAHFDQGELDRIFSRSAELSGTAVVYLIESLCRVSAEELAEPSPRTYSLQKLVEVAELNIGRMRYVWSQMWVHLSRHFISAGCNKQQLVAMYVVDGLRQLSIKFLARDELGSLGFQRDFMKPFEVIASNTPRADVREFIIAALGQMVDAKGYNIMSGWHSVLTTLGKCSSSSEHSVVFSAAEVLHRITLRKMHLLNTTDLLTDIVNAWSMLGGNVVDKNVALCAIYFIRLMGTVANKGVPIPADAKSGAYFTATDDLFVGRKTTFISLERLDALVTAELSTCDTANPETFADFRTWLSVFAALSSLTSVPDHHVRLEAVTTFFKTLGDHALVFSADDWEMITGGTIMPIFENIFCDIGMLEQDRVSRTATTPAEEEAIRADRKHHIRLLENTFESYTRFYIAYHRALPHHLPCLLDLLLSCSSRSDPQVTNAGQGKLQILLTAEEVDLTEDEWRLIADSVTNSMTEEVQILEVLESSLASNRVHEATSMVHALVRTLMTVSASIQNPKVPGFVVLTWLKLFLQCHRCASKVLDDPKMASSLRKFVTGRIVLDLQREACCGLVKCFGKVPPAEQLEVETWMSAIIRRFALVNPQNPEFAVLHEIILFILRLLCDLPDGAFRSLFLSNYGGLCALINNPDPIIRKCLSAAFLRLGNVTTLYVSTSADAVTMVLPEAPDLNTAPGPAFAPNVSVTERPRASSGGPSSSGAQPTPSAGGTIERTTSATSSASSAPKKSATSSKRSSVSVQNEDISDQAPSEAAETEPTELPIEADRPEHPEGGDIAPDGETNASAEEEVL